MESSAEAVPAGGDVWHFRVRLRGIATRPVEAQGFKLQIWFKTDVQPSLPFGAG